MIAYIDDELNTNIYVKYIYSTIRDHFEGKHAVPTLAIGTDDVLDENAQIKLSLIPGFQNIRVLILDMIQRSLKINDLRAIELGFEMARYVKKRRLETKIKMVILSQSPEISDDKMGANGISYYVYKPALAEPAYMLQFLKILEELLGI